MAEKSPIIIDPQEIASYLGSLAEPISSNNLPRDIKELGNCWAIYLLSPLTLREANIYLLPEVSAVKIVSKHPRPWDGEVAFGLTGEVADVAENGENFVQGITEVSYKFNPKAKWVDFRRETNEYLVSLKINRFGFPLSSFRLK